MYTCIPWMCAVSGSEDICHFDIDESCKTWF